MSRAQGRSAHLCRARQRGQGRLRDGLAQARDEMGRGDLRPRIRPRHLHDRRGRRLQFRRDGEQGPQHLQRQGAARHSRNRDRRRLCAHRRRGRPRIFPQLVGRPHHLPRLVPALAQGGPHRLPRLSSSPRDMRSRARQAHRGREGCCALRQFQEDAGPLAHPVQPRVLHRPSTISTPPPSTKRAPRSSA